MEVALPPLGRLSDHARFVELLPASRVLPAAPRFIYGTMPANIATEFFARAGLPPVGIYNGKNLTIGDGLLLQADRRLIAAPEVNFQPAHMQQSIAKFGLPDPAAPIRRLPGPHALIAGPGYHIYGHWLAEILPKLAVLEAAGWDLDRLKLLMPADTPSFAFEMLRLLGFASEQFVPIGGQAGAAQVEQLLLPSFLHNAVRYSEILLSAVAIWRLRVEKTQGSLRQGGYPQQLFVARRGGSRRMAEREAVESCFADAGFAVVVPEQLSLLEQWRMFADAKEIAGEYGSALHGSLFSAPGTTVCCLRGSSFHPAFIQSGIGDVLSQPTGYVFGANDDEAKFTFGVQLADVRACLETVFAPDIARHGRAFHAPMEPAASAADFVRVHDEAVEEGRLEAAGAAIRRALELEPGLAAAEARRARLLARAGAAGALPAINRAIAAGEPSAANYMLKAELLLRAGRGAPALAAARAALALEPQNAEAHDLAAQALLHGGEWTEARDAARAALGLAANEPRFKLTLHAALLELDDLIEAELVIRDLYATSPRLPGVAWAFAKFLARHGRPGEAIQVALQALGESGASPQLRTLLAALLPQSSRIDESSSAAEAAFPVVGDTFDIDFSAGGNSAAHRLAGWSVQEPNGIWAIGPSSEVLFPVLDNSRDWRVTLSVSGFIRPPSISHQSVQILVDGQELGSQKIGRSGAVKLFLPRELLGTTKPPRMRFLHPGCTSPKALGLNKDARQLALHFTRIRLIPVNSQN